MTILSPYRLALAALLLALCPLLLASASAADLNVSGQANVGTITFRGVPHILTQPPDKTIDESVGQTNISITAAGASTLGYFWHKTTNAALLSTSNQLVWADFSEADGGNYYCKVSNHYGSVISTTNTMSVPAGPSPTNLVGYTALAWWRADSYTTNGGIGTWPDWSGNGHNLTNPTAATLPIKLYAFLNGKDVLDFNQGALLTNKSIVAQQPIEICYVYWHTNALAYQGLFSAVDSSTFMAYEAQPEYDYNAGTVSISSIRPTSLTWIAAHFIFNGASTYCGTNTVIAALASAGSNGCTNFSIGQAGWYLRGKVAEIAIYTNTLSTSARSNLFWYCTNRYGAF